jgi:hypothetical protein
MKRVRMVMRNIEKATIASKLSSTAAVAPGRNFSTVRKKSRTKEEPLYQMQPVKSSAHVFREKRRNKLTSPTCENGDEVIKVAPIEAVSSDEFENTSNRSSDEKMTLRKVLFTLGAVSGIGVLMRAFYS